MSSIFLYKAYANEADYPIPDASVHLEARCDFASSLVKAMIS
jgi:hypothetical protein